MDPLTGLLAGGATGLLGGALGLIGTNQTNQTAMQVAQQQDQFQESMANTQYQRGTQDLEKAGLNPMLAYMSSAAPSPSGVTPQISNPGPGMQSAISTAASTAQQQMQLSMNQADTVAGVSQKLASARATNAQADLTSNTLGAKTQSAQLEERMYKTVNSLLDKMNLSPSGVSSAGHMLEKAVDWGVNKFMPYDSPLGMGTLGNTPMPQQ